MCPSLFVCCFFRLHSHHFSVFFTIFFCLFCLFSVTGESGRQKEERAKGRRGEIGVIPKGVTFKVRRTKKKIRIEWRIRHRRRQLLPQLNENVGCAVSCPEKKKELHSVFTLRLN